MLDDYPGMSCGVWQHRPESIGYVRAKSTDIFVDPAIQPNYLSHEIDQRALVGGIKLARRLLQTPELSRFVDARDVSGRRHSHRRRDPALGPPIWRHGLAPDRHLPDGPGHRHIEVVSDRAQGPRAGEPARDRRLGDAEHAVGQHLFVHHGDRREGLRPDPRQGRAGAGGAAELGRANAAPITPANCRASSWASPPACPSAWPARGRSADAWRAAGSHRRYSRVRRR